uniref:Uncharacterized protein n=1 Tax=Meloidogyne hapla TaxID=6305 RepID=A0A1I8B219_MELHA
MTRKLRGWAVELWKEVQNKVDRPYCLITNNNTPLKDLKLIYGNFFIFYGRMISSIEDLKLKDVANTYENTSVGKHFFQVDLEKLWQETMGELFRYDENPTLLLVEKNIKLLYITKKIAAFEELIENGDFDKDFIKKIFKAKLRDIDIEKIVNEINLLDKGKKNKYKNNNKNSKNQKKKQNKLKTKNEIIEENDEENNNNKDITQDNDEKINQIKYYLNTEGLIEKIIKERNDFIKNNINLNDDESWEKINNKKEMKKIEEDEEKLNVFPLEYSWNNHLKLDYHKYLYENDKIKNNDSEELFKYLNNSKEEEENNEENENKFNEKNKLKMEKFEEKELDLNIEDVKNKVVNEDTGKNDEKLKNEDFLENHKEINKFYPKIFLDSHLLDVEYINLINSNNEDKEKIFKLLNIGVFVEEIKLRIEYIKRIMLGKTIIVGSLEGNK